MAEGEGGARTEQGRKICSPERIVGKAKAKAIKVVNKDAIGKKVLKKLVEKRESGVRTIAERKIINSETNDTTERKVLREKHSDRSKNRPIDPGDITTE